MPFPFFAPLSPWIVQVMEERESNPIKSIYRSPFVILTSGALVVKGSQGIADQDQNARREEIKKLLDGNQSDGYSGCIISNNINNLELSYSTGETIVGLDFNGKYIKVDNETGRRVSTPIIETVDIDTDGANNTLKTAKIAVRCFTLKQLEMFELFFMKPGMNVLIEWGDTALLNTNIKIQNINDPVTARDTKRNTYQNGKQIDFTTYATQLEALVPKNGTYDSFCDNFSKYYRSDTTAAAEYMTRVECSLGSYDLVAGKVLDYSFSVEPDGTYMANFEVSQGNQISLALPHSKRKETSNEKVPPTELTTYSQILQQIIVDFNLKSTDFINFINAELPDGKKTWEDDFFNFIKINKEQKDTVASDKAYVSLRFVLHILMNYVLKASGDGLDTNFFKLEKQLWLDEAGKKIECIPVTSNKYILSPSEDIIYPRADLPKLYAPQIKQDKNGKDIKPTEPNEVSIDRKKTTNGKIGGYDFHLEKKLKAAVAPTTPNESEVLHQSTNNPDERLGNALNIFIKYETIVNHWKKTYTRIDFLEKVLETVNNNSFGLFRLVYGLQYENGPATIIDYKLAPDNIKIQNTSETYRFKPTTINSIVKEFSFNFEMSNLVAGRTIFNSGKFLADLEKENKGKKPTDVGYIELPVSVYKAVDNSTFGNADGWYSINNVEFKKIKQNLEKAKENDPNKTGVTTEDQKKEEATTEIEDFNEVIKNQSVNFLIDESTKSNRVETLIYKDRDFIQDYIEKSEKKKNKPTTSPISVSLTIDGFSGFRCGQYFNLDGIPEIYNQVGVFQITNTKHTVSKEGWNTTLEADFRVVSKDKK
jgi:hypothetical protein